MPYGDIPPTHGSTVWNSYPCMGMGYHDFAVGPTHAVCNRCEKVIKVGPDVRWDPPRIAGGSGNPQDWKIRFDSTAIQW